MGSQNQIESSGEAKKIQVDLSKVSFIQESSESEGKILVECTKCDAQESLQSSLFSSKSSEQGSAGLAPTYQIIRSGTKFWGHLIGIIVAWIIGTILTIWRWPPNTWERTFISATAIAIWWILATAINDKIRKKIPVFLYKCKNCGNNYVIASDGIIASIGILIK